MAKKGEQFDNENSVLEIRTAENKQVPLWESLFGIVIGIVGLKLGGDLVVNNSVEIAKFLGISEKLISLTIVAFSTSLPELITSITATKKGETDMAIGNILGSQLFNILLIIGYDSNLILLIVGSIVLGLFPFIGKKNEMTRSNGILFVVTYIAYLVSIVCFA